MRDLIPCETILAAKAGDFEAMDIVLKHYAPLITKHSIRVFYDKFGNCCEVVDEDMRQRIEAELAYQIIYHFDPTQLPPEETLEA